MTDLFIGVVSHEGSRFALSQGPEGLAARLADRLSSGGLSCQVKVNTDDAHDPQALPIDGRLVADSLTEQIRLEGEWARFLAAGTSVSVPRRLGRSAMLAARWARQGWLHMRPWQGAERTDSSGARLVRRLINIELSHVDLWRCGVASGAPWVLVIEDDASSPDVTDCAAGLAGLLFGGEHAGAFAPAYVNLSVSFTPEELGIAHLVSPVPDVAWAGAARRSVLRSSRPVTNTVCAIAYRADFLAALLAEFDALPMTPVVPIDWKLNVALMRMFERGELGDGSCWLVEPGPIVQMSMQQAVT